MDLTHQYTVKEVIEIINTLTLKDRGIVKNSLFLEETDFEILVKEDFKKYDSTFKALA